ncbi:RebB family R body protein [Corallococcus exiguus]|uniref:RebB family R body protein n=1 Tax=Corallococcus exiguus TaxID=83462 RepID=UPI0015618A93|nr:RebB family R body protein [Corallococcus exiguus]MBN8466719.1 RebB family R body protein [Corallococcus exiguus]NRD43926.1 RebB family R body protein [Corallococcus exiguus]
MAVQTTVNPQITDAIATTQAATVGEASSVAFGMLFQMEAQSFAMGMQNAVMGQRGMQQIGEAVIAATCARLLQAIAPPPTPSKG